MAFLKYDKLMIEREWAQILHFLRQLLLKKTLVSKISLGISFDSKNSKMT